MSSIDAPGTCHLVGCPGKGTVDEHVTHAIGAGTWTDYTDPAHCLGFPTICADRTWLLVECSISKSSGWHTRTAHLKLVAQTTGLALTHVEQLQLRLPRRPRPQHPPPRLRHEAPQAQERAALHQGPPPRARRRPRLRPRHPAQARRRLRPLLGTVIRADQAARTTAGGDT